MEWVWSHQRVVMVMMLVSGAPVFKVREHTHTYTHPRLDMFLLFWILV